LSSLGEALNFGDFKKSIEVVGGKTHGALGNLMACDEQLVKGGFEAKRVLRRLRFNNARAGLSIWH
jgi:hypothetical protein